MTLPAFLPPGDEPDEIPPRGRRGPRGSAELFDLELEGQDDGRGRLDRLVDGLDVILTIAGTVMVTAALAVLAGPWWAVLVLGVGLLALGLVVV